MGRKRTKEKFGGFRPREEDRRHETNDFNTQLGFGGGESEEKSAEGVQGNHRGEGRDHRYFWEIAKEGRHGMQRQVRGGKNPKSNMRGLMGSWSFK